MQESSETPEKLESAEAIREQLVASAESGDLKEAIDSTAETLVDSIRDELENGLITVQDLKETVQESWEQNRQKLPTELPLINELDKFYQVAFEVINEARAWVEQNPEKCEAAAKLLLLLLVGLEAPDTLLEYLNNNPDSITEIFASLAS